MLTSNELLDMIEALEDQGLDLQFQEVILQIEHRLRPDVPITIYIGSTWEDHVGIKGETIH